jgi:hypothetical protein
MPQYATEAMYSSEEEEEEEAYVDDEEGEEEGEEGEEDDEEDEEGEEGEEEEEDHDEEEEEDWSLAVRVLGEYWTPRSLRYPQRVFLVLLENGEQVETVAEDCKDKLRLTAAEKNPFFERVIGLWRAAGNAQPTREQFLKKLR